MRWTFTKAARAAWLSGLLSLAASVPIAVAAQPPLLKNSQASATWDQSDSCSESEGSLFFYTATLVNQGNTANQNVYFRATNSNFCAETFLRVEGYASSPAFPQGSIQQFTIAPNDSFAAVKARIPVDVCIFSLSGPSCTSHTAIVNVSLTATDHLYTQTLVQILIGGSSYLNETRDNGTVAPAIASGSISLEDGTVLISGNSQDGQIAQLQPGVWYFPVH
jgi:hypothetical protein